MRVRQMKLALFPDEEARPGRVAFTMTRFNLLRLSWNALVAAVRGEKSLAITTGDLEVLEDNSRSTTGEGGE